MFDKITDLKDEIQDIFDVIDVIIDDINNATSNLKRIDS